MVRFWIAFHFKICVKDGLLCQDRNGRYRKIIHIRLNVFTVLTQVCVQGTIDGCFPFPACPVLYISI